MAQQQTRVIVNAGYSVGQLKVGVELGPGKILEAGLLTEFEKNKNFPIEMIDKIELKSNLEKLNICSSNNVPLVNPSAVSEATHNLYISINHKIDEILKVQNSKFPRILTLGGDHSIAIGSIAAISDSLSKHSNNPQFQSLNTQELCIVWFDAHADVNTPASTNSGNIHGCPIAFLASLQFTDIEQFNWLKQAIQQFRQRVPTNANRNFVDFRRLGYIGLRDVDTFEQEVIDSNNIISFPMTRFKQENRDIRKIVNEILNTIDPEQNRLIHLSFDVDGLDPLFAPSTGTLVEDGVQLEEAKEMVQILKSTGRLVSLDITEVNPQLGTQEDSIKTVNSAVEIAKIFLE
eukprot:TRINITY_DN62_c3_g1_i1.p1 TRINITY_DN62_c3_g1~~TRINITY_DN62_c3_g1_i1.p1  ORF type:complete len:347 (+),score=178.06 TRINITY_DN62_c3_g1_i1:109-1149(+)